MLGLNILERLLDLLYREKDICFVCGDHIPGLSGHICADCRDELSFVGLKRCSICGISLRAYRDDKLYLCRDCEVRPKHFEKAVAPLEYSGLSRKLIRDFKYHDELHYKKMFGELMVQEILDSDMENADLVLGVPLSLKKENKRGYNQAKLLSDYISKKLGIKSGEGLLLRDKDTKVQNELGKEQRMKNLKNAFVVASPDKIKGKSILLIDDIYTTGATVDECAKTLLECGAKKVTIATVATAVDRKYKEE